MEVDKPIFALNIIEIFSTKKFLEACSAEYMKEAQKNTGAVVEFRRICKIQLMKFVYQIFELIEFFQNM